MKALVIGGTGTIGKEIVKRLLREDCQPCYYMNEIIVFSRDEKKQDDMKNEVEDKRVKYYLGDIRDKESLNNAMKGVNFVFHTAAFKQITSCEDFPVEAYKTNIIGTQNIIDVSIENNISKVIIISTDKAVYPVNAMGISKAMMEKLVIAKSKENIKTIFCLTRFGNILCSRSSVVCLFIKQIKNKLPLTITAGNMSRFIMTKEEASELIFSAFLKGEQGDIFIFDSPSCLLNNLIIALEEIFKIKVEKKYIGIRSGEKMSEVLFTQDEYSRIKKQDNYFVLKNNGAKSEIIGKEFNSLNSDQLTVEEIKEIFLKDEYIINELKGIKNE